jgi:hypothetical protein
MKFNLNKLLNDTLLNKAIAPQENISECYFGQKIIEVHSTSLDYGDDSGIYIKLECGDWLEVYANQNLVVE